MCARDGAIFFLDVGSVGASLNFNGAAQRGGKEGTTWAAGVDLGDWRVWAEARTWHEAIDSLIEQAKGKQAA